MLQRNSFCLMALFCLGCTAPYVSAANFSKLPIAMEVSSMTASEDGQLVILSHRASNKLSVWHVESEKVIHTVPCASPGAVLSRGDRTYVLSLGEGTVSVFSHSTWEMIDQIESPSVGKANLTAPQGKAFKGVMVMSELVDSYGSKLHLIDTQNDRFKELGKAAASGMTSSFTGKVCIEQGSVSFSPSATLEVKGSFDEYLGDRKKERIRGAHETTPLLYQVRENEFWFGGNRIYRGLPPKPIGESLGRIVVPDRNRDLAYALTPQSLTCKSLTGSMAEIGRTKISFPKSLSRMKNKAANKKWGEVDRQHVAVTHGDSLYVFIYSDVGNVYRAKMKAFAAPAATSVASTNPIAMPDNATAPTVAPNGNNLLPTQVLLGKELTFKVLPGDVTGEFSLVQGPEGAVVDNKGNVTWTPTNKQLGEQRIKIRAKLGDTVQFLRFNTFVVTRMGAGPAMPVVAAAPGAESGPDVFAKLPIAMQTTAMVITEDGKHLILSHAASDKLTVWNIQDKVIEESIDCDSPAKMISRGKNTYIGSGGGKISVLNHATWQINRKTADVGVNEINALTAPQGRFFKGIVLVSSHFDRNSGQFTMVDVARNRAKVWHKTYDNSTATCSYNGKYVLTQAGNAGQIDVHESFNEIAAGRKTRSPGRNGERCPLIGQVRNNEFWFGSKWVFRGMPPKRTGDECLQIVVGDRNHDVFYRIDEQRIVAFSMKANFQEIGSARVEFPRDFGRMHEDLRKSHHNGDAEAFDRDQVAITIDNTLHLFLINNIGDVYSQGLSAFVRTPMFSRTKGYKTPNVEASARNQMAATRPRDWKARSGNFTVRAVLQSDQGDKVVLKRADNAKIVTVPKSMLSDADIAFLRSLKQSDSVPD